MQHEILFRGKRMDNGEWVCGYYICKQDPLLPGIDTNVIVTFDENSMSVWNKVDPDTVGQYTGLTDKNGVKIFEGDIVCNDEPEDMEWKPLPVFGEVKFGEYDGDILSLEYPTKSHHVGFFVDWKDNEDGDYSEEFRRVVFIKNYSPQVLKANMKIVGATEYGLLLYRDKLPKFRNDGQMIFNWFPWDRDGSAVPKIHETQKPVRLLKRLIEIFTDPGDVVIDPCAGSGSTLRAAYEIGRNSYGFEISKAYYREAVTKMLSGMQQSEPAIAEQERLF